MEHIIPESLGNTAHTLQPGVVCDKCNNYFSRDVERPFLESPAIRDLRFRQRVPSKRGRVPSLNAILAPHHPATLSYDLKLDLPILSLESQGIRHVLGNERGSLIIPAMTTPPNDLVVSRFLAKVALESMAARLLAHPDGLSYLVDETQLDPIRRHAREGFPKSWPYYVRRIYDPDRHLQDEHGNELQTVHESDILQTDWGEWFFVLAIFGLELTINFGGPDISGYLRWIEFNEGASPLYTGKNASIPG